ncbi:hypothetical protein LJC68_03155 [Bacteroidales bacterium OttesenSCG-928-B11]|nr:hypothetical protein [Bacteroidales bacterium OttesenSCG-928-E04]MDL2308560.1 hypothetical protein [Bacteroidales bacterium OttesenSCG-928-C03]MDL2311858.1 hypothetical protein [Bacteroidales bacterium OttesenSCG-928-B11]MDL2326524.1 hypothetical protein [Bacteroidales bacterium OttesenSCG-928-A14]
MKKSDILVICLVIILLAPFFIFNSVYDAYSTFNANNPLIMAFIKFAILATFGEMLGLRIKTGHYNQKGFGIAPRCVVWGFFGMWIAIGMGVFSRGIPMYLDQFSPFAGIVASMGGPLSVMKICGAFFISLMMNTSFAPVFMTAHKISDTHILNNGGKFSALLKPIPVKKIISSLNWEVQWGFVFKKTIPFFWIPAHTITFLLPQEMQVLFAALCSVVLGLFMSIASLKGKRS